MKCETCGHDDPHNAAGIGVCRHDGCGCDGPVDLSKEITFPRKSVIYLVVDFETPITFDDRASAEDYMDMRRDALLDSYVQNVKIFRCEEL